MKLRIALMMIGVLSSCGADARAPFADATTPDAPGAPDANASVMDSSAPDAMEVADAGAGDAGSRIVTTSTSPPTSCETACGGANNCNDAHVWLAISQGSGFATYGSNNDCLQGFQCRDVPPVEVTCINGRFRLTRYRCACR